MGRMPLGGLEWLGEGGRNIERRENRCADSEGDSGGKAGGKRLGNCCVGSEGIGGKRKCQQDNEGHEKTVVMVSMVLYRRKKCWQG